MINLTRLYSDNESSFWGDALRYAETRAEPTTPKPVVVWNCTRRCNLRCVHCYAASDDSAAARELSTDEARAMIDDLSAFGAPVLLFSGGEPLLRDDLFDLLHYAAEKHLRTVLSTNGTRITPEIARNISNAAVAYVGVSLDAADAKRNDDFRGVPGTFEKALAGLRASRDAGVKVGVRFTMTRRNLDEIDALFDLIRREQIPRVCFYHFVPAGRGKDNLADTPSHEQVRAAMDTILARTRNLNRGEHAVEVLTVGNHADGPYTYLKLRKEDSDRAADALNLLRRNGGNRSGEGIACVAWDGTVHPDQFWRSRVIGNVLESPLSEIWRRPAEASLLGQLRNRKPLLQGRCTHCRFLDVCNGNLRARAEAAGQPIWGDDPACYLTDEEIREVSS
ncbi:MAG: radical SAM protein [Phycisphaerae bacterium]|nr:radical SAM protein [Phycisphaerae bacterium]